MHALSTAGTIVKFFRLQIRSTAPLDRWILDLLEILLIFAIYSYYECLGIFLLVDLCINYYIDRYREIRNSLSKLVHLELVPASCSGNACMYRPLQISLCLMDAEVYN